MVPSAPWLQQMQEMSLQLSHRELVLRNLPRELLRKLIFARVEPQEELLYLVGRSVVQLNLQVGPAGSQNRRVQLVQVVGGHEDNPAFLRPDPVQSVQQAREGYVVLVLLLGLSVFKEGIDIFKSNYRPLRSFFQHDHQSVVVHLTA